MRPFPDVNTGRWQPSAGDGGTAPVWSPDTQELFYTNAAGTGLMVVAFQQDASFIADTPRLLFENPDLRLGPNAVRLFDVSSDGQRFLMLKQPTPSAGDSNRGELRIVINWFEELRARVPIP